MKKRISSLLSMALALTVATQAHATECKHKPHGLAYKLTHMGLVHKIAKVASVPGFVAGLTFTMVGGLIAIPFVEGMDYFQSQPFVSW